MTTDTSVQFNLTAPDPPPQPPQWLRDLMQWLNDALKPVGRFFNWLGQLMPDAPFARFLIWTLIIAAAAAFLFLIYQRLRHGEWRLSLKRRETVAILLEEEEEWRPETGQARSWLEEADRLAGEGRFAEAIHHLLLRSVEDIASRRPKLVRPALTSRELAASEGFPAAACNLFAQIAALVERSLFGGRSVGRADWEQARASYSDFALPQAWRA